MWFKYFSREEWDLRLWKGYNLKFEANVYGSSRNMYVAQFHSLIFKIFRCEGVLRYVLFVGGWSLIATAAYFTSESRAKKALIEEEKERAVIMAEKVAYLKSQQLNRYNKPTMPFMNLTHFVDWLTNPTAINDALEFIGQPSVVLALDDQLTGLDSWLPKSDRQIVEFAKQVSEDHH